MEQFLELGKDGIAEYFTANTQKLNPWESF